MKTSSHCEEAVGRRSNDCGFTLIELIITVVLVVILVGTLWMVFYAGFSTFYNQDTRIRLKGEAGRAFIGLEKELREATSVTSAAAADLTFTLDTDDNGVDETVQYVWSGTAGTALNRVSGGATTPVVSKVNSLALSYYNSADALLSFPVTASQVRAVAVDLTAADGDETFQLRSRMRLRNL